MINLRDSGLDWLGHVPSHWTTRPLWTLYRRVKDVEHPEEQMLSVFREHGVVVKDDYDNLNQTAENRNIYQLVHPGWLVVNRMKAWQGSVGISDLRGIVSGHYICFSPIHSEDCRYLNWLLRSDVYRHAYQRLSRGVRIGQAEIDNDSLRQLPVLLPPRSEQVLIADFLDSETAQIDAMIEAQRELANRLHERQTSVSRALTLGVGTDQLSSTGSWLDESIYPVERLGLHCEVVNGSTPSRERPEYWGGDYPWLNSAVANLDRVQEGSEVVTPLALRECHLPRVPAGAVLIAITGQGKTRGLATELMIEATINQHLAAIIPAGEHWVTRYLVFVLRGAYQQLREISDVAGSTRGALTLEDLKHFKVPRPTVADQHQIVDRLTTSTTRMEEVTAATNQSIVLMQERRAALISAAVTGRIDPRTGKESAPEKVLEPA